MLFFLPLWVAGIYHLDAGAQILLFVTLPVLLIVRYGRRFSHPISWFSFFFSLYSLYYPLNQLMLDEYTASTQQSLFLHAIALSAFAFYFLCRWRRESRLIYREPALNLAEARRFSYGGDRFHIEQLLCWAILAVLVLITMEYVIKIYLMGFSSKREINDFAQAGGISGGIAFLPLTICGFLIFVRQYFVTGRVSLVIWLLTGWLMFCYLVGGERDLVFRLLLISVFFVFDFIKKFSRVYYLFGLAFLVVIMPISQALKALLLSDGVTLISFDKIFIGEFTSSGRNVAVLLEYDVDVLGLQPLIWDIKRFLGMTSEGGAGSSVAWFNYVFRVDHGIAGSSGWGFSLVGFFYIVMGELGVFAGFYFLALVCGLFFRRMLLSAYWYVFYVVFITIVIYVQRGDFANLLSLSIKSIAVPLVFIFLVSLFCVECSRKFVKLRSFKE